MNNQEYSESQELEQLRLEYAEMKGKAEGRAEAKLAMAKSMLEKGIDVETIISITGLTAEEIMAN